MTESTKQLKSDGKPYYPHKYKQGKQTEVIEPDEFKVALKQAEQMGEYMEHLAFAVLLWNSGVRKSEAYERQLNDVTLEDDFVVVDFGLDFGVEKGARKKHGKVLPPLRIPRSFVGVEDYLVPWVLQRRSAKKGHEHSYKWLNYQIETGKTRIKKFWGKPKEVPELAWRHERVRAVWLFPHIGKNTAITIVKRILGDKYYPHYLRLRKGTMIAASHSTIGHVQSVLGIKTVKVIEEAYLGVSRKVQDEAMHVE